MSASDASARIVEPATPEELASVKALFREYAGTLGFSLSFQGFEREMAIFPGDYAPPRGVLLLAEVETAAGWQPAGAVGLRPLAPMICEMKRMYVRPAFRSLGLGRRLVEAVIAAAQQRGYARMRLDTVPASMREAVGLYRRFGFSEIAAYYRSELKDALYMERELLA